MRWFHVALMVLGLGVADANAAAGPYWHRSAVLDYRVAADGTSVATETWEIHADTNAIAQTIAQQTYSFVADLERVELIAAYTRKSDGRVLAVPSSSVMDKAVSTSASAPQFSALTARTIVFPQVAAGDTVHYELRRTTKESMFPGEFLLDVEPGGSATTDSADIRITLAPGRTLQTTTSGLEELPAETEPDGSVRRHWGLARNADGPIALEASTFTDYRAIGLAYAVRAWPAALPGAKVQALADELVPDGTDRREAALLLYRYVATNIRYVATFFGKGRVVPRDAETVLADGWGDCKDHAALLQALLAAKGIAANPALISMHNRYDLPETPGLTALDHVITYVPSLDLFLDSTAPYAPFGVLPSGEYDKPVVLADPRDAREARTPPMPASGMVLSTQTEARIDDEGAVTGHTTTAADGPQSIALRSMAAWFEGRGAAYAASAQLQQLGTPGTGHYAFVSPENAASLYQVEGWFTLDDKLPEGGTLPFVIPGGLGVFGRPGRLLLSAGLTDDGVHTCFPGRETEQIVLDLPHDMHLSALPANVDILAGGARYTSRYGLRDGALTVMREFSVSTDHQRCSPAEFDAMRAALDAAHRDGQARITLVPDAPQQVAAAPTNRL
jgi:transglutaminase-like putative cysteine protease